MRLEAEVARGPQPSERYLPASHVPIPGNACQLLRDGVEAYPSMLAAIAEARHEVRLETYMFYADSVGHQFRDALISAARRGVRVCVLYDAVGSWPASRAFFRVMRKAGVHIRAFRPVTLRFWRVWLRDHRKILVVDGRVAFTGGINIAAHWAPSAPHGGWRDDVLRFEGPAVRQLERTSRAGWRFLLKNSWRSLSRAGRKRRFPTVCGDVALSVLSSRRSIHRAYLHALERARERVMVAAAYFVPDRRIFNALHSAAGRGVKVMLLLNGRSDHRFLEFATRHYYEPLLRAGVRIFEWQGSVLHAKTAVVDGVWGTLGSFNLERMSLNFNHETNVVFTDTGLAGAVERSFESDCGFCHEVHLTQWMARPRWQKLLERACFVFRKIL